MNKGQTAAAVIKALKKTGTPTRAMVSAWFFKTEPGQYGHGDVFIGVTVPVQRTIAKQFRDLPMKQIDRLLKSKVHEHRLTAWLILCDQFERADKLSQKKIVQFFLRRTRYANNWDMVDTAAPAVLGEWLLNHPRGILHRLALSKNIWERRISIIATQTLIRHNEYAETLRIAKILLHDDHDLIHKAVGWMLREVGNRDRAVEQKFLRPYCRRMPRTMLRYAIEKFPPSHRARYLKA